MICLSRLTIVLLICEFFIITLADDFPCLARQGNQDQGQTCVCNSSYCDTVERPTPLPQGSYYLYTTSNSTPGFSRTGGTFSTDSARGGYDIVFKVNSSVQYQVIHGFGGSFTDSAGMAVKTLPEEAQDRFMQSYFGDNGIEYTMGRVPIGGSDFSLNMYTLDNVTDDDNLHFFNLTDQDYTYKLPMIKKAMAVSCREEFKLYGCPWNAPGWMKTSNNTDSGFILSKYRQLWAEYIVKFIQEYNRNGANIWAVSGGNQVFIDFFWNVEDLNVLATAPIQRQWLKENLKPLLKSSNLSHIKFIALDDQRSFAPYWIKRFANDPEALEAMDAIGLHWYFDWLSSTTILDDFHQSFPDKLILYTESSINPMFGGNPVELGSWGRAALYIYNIIENFNHWANCYIDWNLALDTSGGPYIYLPLDAAVIINKTGGEFYKQPMFYGLGHFSKFIPPGSRRMDVQSNVNPPPSPPPQSSRPKLSQFSHQNKNSPFPIVAPAAVTCLATANSDGSNTVIVLNNKDENVTVRIEVSNLGSLVRDLEARSINSFIYWH